MTSIENIGLMLQIWKYKDCLSPVERLILSRANTEFVQLEALHQNLTEAKDQRDNAVREMDKSHTENNMLVAELVRRREAYDGVMGVLKSTRQTIKPLSC